MKHDDGWNKCLAEIWTKNVAPSRPSSFELSEYTRLLRSLQKKLNHKIRLLVLGSTPEFRDWGYEEDMEIHVVDKSIEYYTTITREVRHKQLKETFHLAEWEEMSFDCQFDIIIGDLSIGNIDYQRFDNFLYNIQQALSEHGLFIGKSFIWEETIESKTPKQIIDDYYSSIPIHPYTFINHQLGYYCLDKEKNEIDFSRMYNEMYVLYESGIIDRNLFSYFQNIGWDTEMKFKFFAPSKSQFEKRVMKFFPYVSFIHTEDIYSCLFPIFIISKSKNI